MTPSDVTGWMARSGTEPSGAPLGSAARTCQLLVEDEDLAGAVGTDHGVPADAELLAPVLNLPTGAWKPDPPPDGAGLLVLSGLLIRRVGIRDRYGAELLGAGDLLRPQQLADFTASLSTATDFRVLSSTRVAVLDDRVTARLTRYPPLSLVLIDKAMRRARVLATTMAILHQSHLETRLCMLLWLLAARWGRVRTDGTLLPIPLTHEVLAELIAARRPTVSTAMSELARQQKLSRTEDGLLLHGTPPAELLEIAV